jgi:xanthine dehydrogenase accessory factor
MSMEGLYLEITKALEKGERLALATLIHRVGSAPRAVGAKYLVKEDGTSFGSVGGGSVEAEVWQRAQKMIQKGEGGILHFNLTAEQLAAGGSICGGTVDVFVEPLRKEHLEIYREMVKIGQKGGAALLATLISVNDVYFKREGSKALIKPSGEKFGSLMNEKALEDQIWLESKTLLKDSKTKISILTFQHQKIEILLEPVFSEPTLYIFGGGHVSQQIAPLAKRVHFKVVVIDDREMFANKERFPDADEIMVSEFERCFEHLSIDESSYIVIVTRGHLYDGFVLEQAVKTKAAYVGMIGSKKKIRILFDDLRDKGISKEILDRVYAPIGIDIDSETPEEIAVSIVAQLIKVRSQRVS